MSRTKTNIVLTISRMEIDRRIRKPLPPTSRAHRDKTTYRRHAKHPNKQSEE